MRFRLFSLLALLVTLVGLAACGPPVPPPPNPAKTTDSRYATYRDEYGDESWELDALDPRVITELITNQATDYTDNDKRKALLEKQEEERQEIRELADNWK